MEHHGIIYIDSNEKLADLLEVLLKKDVKSEVISDTKDLIVELRSSSSEVYLLNGDAISRRINKYITENS